MPMTAIIAKQPTNLIPSCENLKSTGFGNNIDLTSSPLDVEKPGQQLLARNNKVFENPNLQELGFTTSSNIRQKKQMCTIRQDVV